MSLTGVRLELVSSQASNHDCDNLSWLLGMTFTPVRIRIPVPFPYPLPLPHPPPASPTELMSD